MDLTVQKLHFSNKVDLDGFSLYAHHTTQFLLLRLLNIGA